LLNKDHRARSTIRYVAASATYPYLLWVTGITLDERIMAILIDSVTRYHELGVEPDLEHLWT
ncbi:hypothetical protein ACXYTJ_17070, partial [Gilvimarinus sp. F26214L]|uniref:hypothetical protein n=1 Tax=Gilvimarinus sp. DZF01 TaxID=3461371 RepID=UPI004045857D